jgi:hypothetical protein
MKKTILPFLLFFSGWAAAQYGFHYDVGDWNGLLAVEDRVATLPTEYRAVIYYFDANAGTIDTIIDVSKVTSSEGRLAVDFEYYNDTVYFCMDNYIIKTDSAASFLDTIYTNTYKPTTDWIKDIAIHNDTLYFLRGGFDHNNDDTVFTKLDLQGNVVGAITQSGGLSLATTTSIPECFDVTNEAGTTYIFYGYNEAFARLKADNTGVTKTNLFFYNGDITKLKINETRNIFVYYGDSEYNYDDLTPPWSTTPQSYALALGFYPQPFDFDSEGNFFFSAYDNNDTAPNYPVFSYQKTAKPGVGNDERPFIYFPGIEGASSYITRPTGILIFNRLSN